MPRTIIVESGEELAAKILHQTRCLCALLGEVDPVAPGRGTEGAILITQRGHNYRICNRNTT